MPGKRLLVAALVMATILAAHASAQERNVVGGLIGRTFISNQGVPNFPSDAVHFGNGLTLEGDYGRRVVGGEGLAALSLEVVFSYNPDEDLNFPVNVIPEAYGSYFITPAARVNLFPGTRLSPWASFGGGFGHFRESDNLVFFDSNPGKTGTTTGVLQLGAGFDVRAYGRFSVRFAVRDFDSGVPQLNVDTGKARQHNIFVGAGILWHF
jgi:hypothetical protein